MACQLARHVGRRQLPSSSRNSTVAFGLTSRANLSHQLTRPCDFTKHPRRAAQDSYNDRGDSVSHHCKRALGNNSHRNVPRMACNQACLPSHAARAQAGRGALAMQPTPLTFAPDVPGEDTQILRATRLAPSNLCIDRKVLQFPHCQTIDAQSSYRTRAVKNIPSHRL